MWFLWLERPYNYKHLDRNEKSRSCCGAAGVVKTEFKVENGDEGYPEDRWYAWINEQWIPIPPGSSRHGHDGTRAARVALRQPHDLHTIAVASACADCGPPSRRRQILTLFQQDISCQ